MAFVQKCQREWLYLGDKERAVCLVPCVLAGVIPAGEDLPPQLPSESQSVFPTRLFDLTEEFRIKIMLEKSFLRSEGSCILKTAPLLISGELPVRHGGLCW